MADRGKFTNNLGFVFAAAGAAVGLGNIWKFPFEVAQGGGAIFLVIYLLICFGICYPLLLAESAVGRASARSAVGAYSKIGGRRWGALGKLHVLTAVLVLSFYNIVAGWAFGYFLFIIRGQFDIDFGGMVNDIFSVGLYAAIFMTCTVLIVRQGVAKGIERASRLLMPILFLMIIALIIYSLTLPHAWAGLAFYLTLNPSDLTLGVVYEAVGQAFFSLSLGLGNVLTYASYLPKDANIIRSTSIVTIADVSVAFLSGLMIFPMVSFITEGNLADMQGGPALLFNTLPQVFQQIGPVVGVIVGGFFFLLITFAALTSTISLLEIPTAYAVDEVKLNRKTATSFMAVFIFLIGVPSMLAQGDSVFLSNFVRYVGGEPKDFMSFIVDFCDTSMIFGGFMLSIFTAYVWRKYHDELALGNPEFTNSPLAGYVDFALRYLCPIVLGAVFVIGTLNKYFSISFF